MLFAVVDHSFDSATKSFCPGHPFVNHPTIYIQLIRAWVPSQLVT